MSSPILSDGKPGLLRDRVADFVREKVREGVYRPGDRVPSVRQLSKILGIAPSTVVDAYRCLEAEGMIRARPQSGFYVPLRSWKADQMAPTRPKAQPRAEGEHALFMRVLNESRHPDVVSLALADPHVEALPMAALHRMLHRATREYPAETVSYDVSSGFRPLREQIARRAIASGCGVSPDEVVVTNGCNEALTLSLSATCRPGDIVAVESPAFYGVLFVIHSLGLRTLEIATHPETGMDMDELERALAEHPIRAVLTNATFANPTGGTIPPVAKTRLVRMLEAAGVPLIEDDVYGDLPHDGDRPVAAKAFDRAGNVLLCSSFSKTLAPGYRVGWVLGGRYQERIAELKFAHSVCTAVAPQIAMAEFLESERYARTVQRAGRMYRENLIRMQGVVERTFPSGTRWTEPRGGFVLWIEVPVGVDAIALYERARDRGVTFMPGPAFSAHGEYANFLRLNASGWNPVVERAVAQLGVEACALYEASRR